MSALELIKDIGKKAEWSDGHGLKYEVTITDCRKRWGETDYLIVPVSGSGCRWVSSYSVKLQEEMVGLKS